jgi:hypothetical protein
MVYELFFTQLPQSAFTAADVVALYLHRGAFEPLLADEDSELDLDRWCSHAPAGQEAWQIIGQWIWNLRLELGHHLTTSALRPTEFAPALAPAPTETKAAAPVQGYASIAVAESWKADRFTGPDFPAQPDGTDTAVRLASFSTPMSDAARQMGVYASSIQVVSPPVALACFENSVNGMGAIPASRAR